jgi:hypothetical protein
MDSWIVIAERRWTAVVVATRMMRDRYASENDQEKERQFEQEKEWFQEHQ